MGCVLLMLRVCCPIKMKNHFFWLEDLSKAEFSRSVVMKTSRTVGFGSCGAVWHSFDSVVFCLLIFWFAWWGGGSTQVQLVDFSINSCFHVPASRLCFVVGHFRIEFFKAPLLSLLSLCVPPFFFFTVKMDPSSCFFFSLSLVIGSSLLPSLLRLSFVSLNKAANGA